MQPRKEATPRPAAGTTPPSTCMLRYSSSKAWHAWSLLAGIHQGCEHRSGLLPPGCPACTPSSCRPSRTACQTPQKQSSLGRVPQQEHCLTSCQVRSRAGVCVCVRARVIATCWQMLLSLGRQQDACSSCLLPIALDLLCTCSRALRPVACSMWTFAVAKHLLIAFVSPSTVSTTSQQKQAPPPQLISYCMVSRRAHSAGLRGPRGQTAAAASSFLRGFLQLPQVPHPGRLPALPGGPGSFPCLLAPAHARSGYSLAAGVHEDACHQCKCVVHLWHHLPPAWWCALPGLLHMSGWLWWCRGRWL